MLLKNISVLMLTILFLLTGCGGGAGGSTQTSSTAMSSVKSVAPSSSTVSSSTISSSTNSSSIISSSLGVVSSMSSSVGVSSSTAVVSSKSSSTTTSAQLSSSVVSKSSTQSSSVIAAPQQLTATGGNISVTVSWSSVAGATGYTLYYATEPNIISKNISAFRDGKSIQGALTNQGIIGLTNNKTYYFVVTATVSGTESAQSAEVSAIPSPYDLAQQPTAQEVLELELVNRARFDPQAEATRFGIGLNDGIDAASTISSNRKSPLAFNIALIDAARKHSQWMLDTDTFSHTGANNSSFTQRMTDSGYVFSGGWSAGENIAWGGTTASTINLTDYAISHHEGLFKSPGHRLNILNTGYRELGIGQKQGRYIMSGTDYLSSMITEDFAQVGTGYFLTGVIYNDSNNNSFYDVGEGLSGVTISANGKDYPVFSTGAYFVPLPNGIYNIVFSGSALGSPINYTITISNSNLKLDVVKTNASVKVNTW